MTVLELIQKLSQLDPTLEVFKTSVHYSDLPDSYGEWEQQSPIEPYEVQVVPMSRRSKKLKVLI